MSKLYDLSPEAIEKIKQRPLTIKQKKFTAEILKTGNGTQSALKIYDCNNSNVAAAIASQNLRKLNISFEVEKALFNNNISEDYIVNKWKKLCEQYFKNRPDISAKSLENLGKIIRIYGENNNERTSNYNCRKHCQQPL